MTAEIVDAARAFGRAQWIWPNVQGFDVVNYLMQARRAFSLDAVPRKCVVQVTADSRYKLFVNGRFIASGPARGFQSHWPYDEVDIAPMLVKGRNVIAAMVLCFGRGTYQYVSADSGGLLLRGKLGRVDISTDAQWRVRRAPGYRRHITSASLQTGYEEFFDARLDDGSWLLPSYVERDRRLSDNAEAPLDSVWKTPDCRVAGCMPWHSFEQRGIPMLREEVIAPKALIAECDGRSAAGWLQADNLTAAYLRDPHDWREASSILKRAKGSAELKVRPSGRGRFRSYVLDFGREVVGSVRLEASGAAGGEIIDAQVFETLTGLEPDIVSPYIGCKVAFANRLTLRKGATSHEQFDHWGFRYALLTVRENARPLTVRVGLRTALYSLDIKAAFRSSDRRLNDIYRISVRAQECCMIDSYVDCPWREQAQWWGDARVQAANTHHLSADSRMLKRGIRQIAAQETPNGLTYGMTPTMSHHCILPDYTLTWVMTIWDYYYQTGDKSLIAEQADRMRRALAYFEDITASNGLLPYDERYWLFLDWAEIFKEGYPTVYNMFYFMALETAAALFGLIGETRDAAHYRGRAKAVREAIMCRLFDAKRGAFYGGFDWKGRPVKHDTPHTYALAVVAGICPERDKEFVTERLLPVVRGEFPLAGSPTQSNPVFPAGTTPSPFFMYYVFEALKRQGRKSEVIDCIRRWWGEFLDWGVSTTPEVWKRPAGSASACHAWSAHPIVHFHAVLLGVTQAAVGWKRIDFAPVLMIDSASGKVATPLGEVIVDWKRMDDTANVSLAVPKGMTARVKLPGARRTVRSGRYHWKVNLK